MLYDLEIPDDEGEPAEACISLAGPVVLPRAARVVMLGEIPAARVAVLVHAGDYASIGDTYRTLGAWVARHAAPSGERIREWYRVGPWDTTDAAASRTEISWPIMPG